MHSILFLLIVTQVYGLYVEVFHQYRPIKLFQRVQQSSNDVQSAAWIDSSTFRYKNTTRQYRNPIINPENVLQNENRDKKRINNVIAETFLRPRINEIDMEKLRLFLQTNADSISQADINTLLHRCGKSQRNVFRLLSADTILQGLRGGGSTDPISISCAIYSLQGIQEPSEERTNLINTICQELQENTKRFDFRTLSTCFFGLRYVTLNDEGVEMLLHHLSLILDTSIRQSNNDLDALLPQGIGMICFGLQGMNNDNEIVQKLHKDLAIAMRRCRGSPNPQVISNILHGFRSSTSGCVESLMLLAEVNDVIEKDRYACIQQMNKKDLCMAIAGLQGFSSSNGEVKRLVCAFNLVFEQPDSPLRFIQLIEAEDVSQAVGGLKSLSSDDDFVRRFVSHISSLIYHPPRNETSRGVVKFCSERHVVRSFLGLRSLSSSHREVLDLVANTTITMQQSFPYPSAMTPRGVSSCLYGSYVQSLLY